MQILVAKDITIKYGQHTAVEQVNFSLDEGDILCVVGENGSGKTSLIRGILDLIPIYEGEVQFLNMNRNQIGYLPQHTIVQRDFPASVYEIVLSGILNRRKGLFKYSKEEKAKALSNMEKLGISELKNKAYRQLSGGQQQRVLLARALCATDKLLVLDEPVTGLDPIVTAEFYELIKKVNKELGMTIIMVSHDINQAVESATHILHVNRKTVFGGKKEDYLKSKVGRRMIGGEVQ